MDKNQNSNNGNRTSNKADRNKESNSNNVSAGATNVVGPSRRYVSGDEEKSSSSHQFHKS